MNNERRTVLRGIANTLTAQSREIENVISDEKDALVWTPRNLRNSKAEKSAVSALETALLHINNAIESIEEVLN